MENENVKSRSNFGGKLGFILAAAGSAVGLGNLWRFPYLAAKYGGGIFLLTYIVFAVTFGFVLMITEISIGRKTKLSPMEAFGSLNKKWKWLGRVATLVPIIILPYYCVIGGWVTKYIFVFLNGEMSSAAGDSYFSSFISKPGPPIFWFALFLVLTAVVILAGVNKGIEAMSRILMPALLILSVGISIFVITRPGSGAGLRYYFVPDFKSFSIKTIVAVVGQLFYSLSLAMGIMITYGSYLNDREDINRSARQIEVFDTAVAILAGLIIVPSVFTFSGGDKQALNKGASLMFVTLPKVFNGMGAVGRWVGLAFFLLVFFAALTSSISIMEAIVAGIDDGFHTGRTKATIITFVYAAVIGILCSLGFSSLSWVKIFGFDILDFCDFISNSIMLPIIGLLTCVFAGFVIGPQSIFSELEKNGEKFKLKKFYTVMVKWIAPVILIVILISSILDALGIVTI